MLSLIFGVVVCKSDDELNLKERFGYMKCFRLSLGYWGGFI